MLLTVKIKYRSGIFKINKKNVHLGQNLEKTLLWGTKKNSNARTRRPCLTA